MINRELTRAGKFCDCCFIPCGHLKIVKSHGICSLTLVLMAASHVAAYIFDEAISQDREKSHMVAI